MRVASGRLVQGHLHEGVDRAISVQARCRQSLDNSVTVDGMHDVGVPRDGPALVHLQLADEVPSQLEIGEFRGLAAGLLVAVLANISYAERGESTDIAGRKGLCARAET